MPTPEQEALDDLFGEDLLFDDDLQVTASSDYATVSGYAALRQSILARLLTAPGEHATQPGYGVGVGLYVKRRAAPADLDELRQRIIDQLGQEPRIERVELVTVERYDSSDQPGVRIVVRVTAIGKEQSFAYEIFQE